jgi:Transcriptional regulatory protein, C terminal
MTRPSFQQIAYTCTRMTKTLNVSVFGAGRGEEVVAVFGRAQLDGPGQSSLQKVPVIDRSHGSAALKPCRSRGRVRESGPQKEASLLPSRTSAPNGRPLADSRARTTRMDDRRNSQPKDVLSFGPFNLFVSERLLKKAGEPIPLGGRALDILIALAQRAGEVVTHKELISTVWPDVTVEDANLRFQMARLRKALGDGRDGARCVSTVCPLYTDLNSNPDDLIR